MRPGYLALATRTAMMDLVGTNWVPLLTRPVSRF